jgi:hypothetical protein
MEKRPDPELPLPEKSVAPEATGPAEEKKAANLKKPDGTKSEGTVKEKISETAATAKGEATDTSSTSSPRRRLLRRTCRKRVNGSG